MQPWQIVDRACHCCTSFPNNRRCGAKLSCPARRVNHEFRAIAPPRNRLSTRPGRPGLALHNPGYNPVPGARCWIVAARELR